MRLKGMLCMQNKMEGKVFMKVIKGVINTVIAFFLTIAILANFLVILCSKTIMNKDYMLGLLEKNGYYEKIGTNLKNSFTEYQYQSGLPEDVFENVYLQEELKKDIDSIINYLYNGEEFSNHSENVKNRVDENIAQFLEKNSIVLTEEQQQNVDNFEAIMKDVYEQEVYSVFTYAQNINDIVVKIEKIIYIVRIVLAGVLIGILLIFLILNVTTLSFFTNGIGCSLLASGILLQLTNWVINKNLDIAHILLFTQSFSDFIKFVLYEILSKIAFFGILFIVLGILGIVMSAYSRSKFKRKELA